MRHAIILHATLAAEFMNQALSSGRCRLLESGPDGDRLLQDSREWLERLSRHQTSSCYKILARDDLAGENGRLLVDLRVQVQGRGAWMLQAKACDTLLGPDGHDDGMEVRRFFRLMRMFGQCAQTQTPAKRLAS